MGNQLLLLEDVDNLGRSGELVSVKPGYARNFLLPQKKAVVADTFTLRLQARLQEERKKQAEVDKTEAEQLALRVQEMRLTLQVKVDPDGNMYGSVAAVDIVHLLEKEGIRLERRNVLLPQPIKEIGVYQVHLRLKEGVPTSFALQVYSDPKQLEAPKNLSQ